VERYILQVELESGSKSDKSQDSRDYLVERVQRGLRKAFCVFEVLIAVPFVKGVGRSRMTFERTDMPLHLFGVRPFFGRFEQFSRRRRGCADRRPRPIHLLPRAEDFRSGADAHVNPTDDEFVHFGEEDGMLRRLELCEPCFYFLRFVAG